MKVFLRLFLSRHNYSVMGSIPLWPADGVQAGQAPRKPMEPSRIPASTPEKEGRLFVMARAANISAAITHQSKHEVAVPIPLAELERDAIVGALMQTGGDTTLTARLLGIGRTTLYRRIGRLGLGEFLLASRLAGSSPRLATLLWEISSGRTAGAEALLKTGPPDHLHSEVNGTQTRGPG